MLLNQHLFRTCLLAMILLASSARATAATDPEDSTQLMAQLDGWQMTISTHQLKNYLSYKGSLIDTITEVEADYRFRDRTTGQWVPFRKYETLWFSNGRPVGCKRFEQLAIQPMMDGHILIANSPQATEQMDAVANSVIRMFLDIGLKRAECNGVVLANDQFDAMTSSLGRCSFYPKRFLNDEAGMLLRVISSKSEREKYFFFRTN
jgi:hypothetical protein